MRYVIVQDGVVINAIGCDAAFGESIGAIASETAATGDLWDGMQFSAPTAADKSRDELKRERAERVAAIKVTTSSGNVFDGDEISQGRMTRAITALKAAEQETTAWILADNTSAMVSLAELEEALILAGQAQTALWVI